MVLIIIVRYNEMEGTCTTIKIRVINLFMTMNKKRCCEFNIKYIRPIYLQGVARRAFLSKIFTKFIQFPVIKKVTINFGYTLEDALFSQLC